MPRALTTEGTNDRPRWSPDSKQIAFVSTRGGAQVDFLHLEYDGGALYLPVWRLDEVQRYVGADGIKPRIDKLGDASSLTVLAVERRRIDRLRIRRDPRALDAEEEDEEP